jgi:hypothetical protein
LLAVWRKVTIPASGRDLLTRAATTSVRVEIVSPANTGAGNATSVMPRLATSVPMVRLCTDMPIIRPSVYSEFTSGRPNSVKAAYSASRCSFCTFMVMPQNITLSASVTVRVHSASISRPSVNSSNHRPDMAICSALSQSCETILRKHV